MLQRGRCHCPQVAHLDNTANAGESHPLKLALAEGLAAAPGSALKESGTSGGLLVTHSWPNPEVWALSSSPSLLPSPPPLSLLNAVLPQLLLPPGWTLQTPVLALPLTTDHSPRPSPQTSSVYRCTEVSFGLAFSQNLLFRFSFCL